MNTTTPSPPHQAPPPLDTNTTALLQAAAAAATQVGAPETWSPQYLVEPKWRPTRKPKKSPPPGWEYVRLCVSASCWGGLPCARGWAKGRHDGGWAVGGLPM